MIVELSLHTKIPISNNMEMTDSEIVTIEKAGITAEDNQLLQLSFTATYTTE